MIIKVIQLLAAILMFPIMLLFHLNKYVIRFFIGYVKLIHRIIKGTYK